MPTRVKVLVGVTIVCGVLVIAAWIALLFLQTEQAIKTTERLFNQLLAPLAIGSVSGVLSGLVVAMMLESKRKRKSDSATGAPPAGGGARAPR